MSYMKLYKIGKYFEREYDGPPGTYDEGERGSSGVSAEIMELMYQVLDSRGIQYGPGAMESLVREAVKVFKDQEEEARAEQAYEMRAAFGPGVEVVNVITGERTRT